VGVTSTTPFHPLVSRAIRAFLVLRWP
jgi:hypothetical protein